MKKNKQMQNDSLTKNGVSGDLFSKIDVLIFILLILFLLISIFSFSTANIFSDSVDYYSILQKIVSPNERTIVPDLPFLEERFPGYSVFSVIPYFGINYLIKPFVKTQVVTQEEIGFKDDNIGHQVLFPKNIVTSISILFKDIELERGVILNWTVLISLIVTSYFILFLGILFIIKSQILLFDKSKILSLSLILIILSPIFMSNILQTPTYATLFAFGVSSVFCYFFIKSITQNNEKFSLISGVILALLAFSRAEGFVIFIVSIIGLFYFKQKELIKNFTLGFLVIVPLFLIYNFYMFNNPFYFGFLGSEINTISFNINFIFDALINPVSGVFFVSPLIVIGVIGLFFAKENNKKILALICITLILVMLFRVPVMYQCDLSNPPIINGMSVASGCSIEQSMFLVKSDMNRYIIVLAPFAIIGLNELFDRLYKKFKK